jgi:hypothetical protein
MQTMVAIYAKKSQLQFTQQIPITAIVEMTAKDNKYWTSGSNAGVGCEETWAWCNSKTLFKTPFTMWKSGAPGAPRRQRCAQLHLQPNVSMVGLEDVTCASEQFFICKVIAQSHFYKLHFRNLKLCRLHCLCLPVLHQTARTLA